MKKAVKNFYDLKVWKDAHAVVLEVYDLTGRFPKEELFGLVSQMRRAASSVAANIAEGFGRYHFKDKIRFYQQARGSAVEMQNHVFLAQDLNYLPKTEARNLFIKLDEVLRELNGLINAANERSLSLVTSS